MPVAQGAREYTPDQRRVIAHDGHHAVVSAVAGSGKTETLIGRLAYLLREIPAERIAVVMFNRDAAREFRERFARRVGGEAPEIRTFHAMGQRITERLVSQGHLPGARLETRDFARNRLAKAALTEVFRATHGSDARPDRPLVESFIQFLGLVKAGIEPPESVLEAGQLGPAAACFPAAFRVYERERNKRRFRCFEDLLYDPVCAIRAEPPLAAQFANRLDHLIVDEAQDVNAVQIELVRILAGERAAVMIVGDEDQSIYAWRGARPEFMSRTFTNDFPGATRYTLPHTFRFGHTVSVVANHLIRHNADRAPKSSLSAQGTPNTRIRTHAVTPKDSGIVGIVDGSIRSGFGYGDIAVLVRTYDLAVTIEMELFQARIPYHVYGRAPLMSVPEISAMVGILQLGSGHWNSRLDEEARAQFLRNILNTPSLYLGREVIESVIEQVLDDPGRLSEALRDVITPASKDYQIRQIRERADSIAIVSDSTPRDMKSATLLRQYRATARIDEAITRQSATQETARTTLGNIDAFIQMAERHGGTIAEFLEELDPLIDTREADPPPGPHIRITSIHRAKGAEFPVVVVPGFANGCFPDTGSTLDPDLLAAERRLCYVAMTRARESLHLLHPADPVFQSALADAGFDGEGRESSVVSRFLWEAEIALSHLTARIVENPDVFQPTAVLDPGVANAYLEAMDAPPACAFHQRSKPERASTGSSSNHSRASVGQRVKVEGFGAGVVAEWLDHRIVRINLENGDSRLFVADMARISTA